MKTAMLSGIFGQDASILAKILLNKDYKVVGLYRHSTIEPERRIKEKKLNNVILECCDITDSGSISNIIKKYQPDEFYSLAAQSDVKVSFDMPELTFRTNVIGVINILDSIKKHSSHTRILQSSSSEMYGNNKNEDGLRNEETKFSSRSPYATSKIAAHYSIINYREAYGLYCCSSICFNHTSIYRGLNFVERKISNYVGWLYNFIKNHDFEINGYSCIIPEDKKLGLGNLEARRDIGYAGDYVFGMWLMLQGEKPIDLVLSTGTTISIKQILDKAFKCIEIDDWTPYVKLDQNMIRPSEVDVLIGDSTKAKNILGWEPTISFETLISDMVENDIQRHANKS
jgi:GDPmannose 4,6-dehydratase